MYVKNLDIQEYAHFNLVKLQETLFIFWGNFAQQIQISSHSMYQEEDIYVQNNIKYLSQSKMALLWMVNSTVRFCILRKQMS